MFRTRLWRRIGPLFGVAVVLLAGQPAQASDGFHGYATARETSNGYTLQGVSVERPDNNPADLPNDGCSAPFSGHPVYQTQWIIVTSDAKNWIEGGTGHQCQSNYQYRFWGYGYLGNWYGQSSSIFDGDFPTLHTFRLDKNTSNNEWVYFYDGAKVGSAVTWDVTGYAEAGLESYASAAGVGKHQYGRLAYKKSGSWSAWSGRDSSTVTPSGGMCGRWSSTAGNDTYWYAAQNRTC